MRDHFVVRFNMLYTIKKLFRYRLFRYRSSRCGLFFYSACVLGLLSGCNPLETHVDRVLPTQDAPTPIPDFAAITDVKAKKAAFFTYLQPSYDVITREVLAERTQLVNLQAKAELTSAEQASLASLVDKYQIAVTEPKAQLDDLLTRVDIIPEAMVLSQAANESGWGTSRFARLGYNFFGQWCFSQGCGLVPLDRNAGAQHEVAKFPDLESSVRSYYTNINRNPGYASFREIRAKQRLSKESLQPCLLTAGLKSYSERGEAYIQELNDMIIHNRTYWRDASEINFTLCEKSAVVVTLAQ